MLVCWNLKLKFATVFLITFSLDILIPSFPLYPVINFSPTNFTSTYKLWKCGPSFPPPYQGECFVPSLVITCFSRCNLLTGLLLSHPISPWPSLFLHTRCSLFPPTSFLLFSQVLSPSFAWRCITMCFSPCCLLCQRPPSGDPLTLILPAVSHQNSASLRLVTWLPWPLCYYQSLTSPHTKCIPWPGLNLVSRNLYKDQQVWWAFHSYGQDMLQKLHWLLVYIHSQFKVLVMTYTGEVQTIWRTVSPHTSLPRFSNLQGSSIMPQSYLIRTQERFFSGCSQAVEFPSTEDLSLALSLLSFC